MRLLASFTLVSALAAGQDARVLVSQDGTGTTQYLSKSCPGVILTNEKSRADYQVSSALQWYAVYLAKWEIQVWSRDGDLVFFTSANSPRTLNKRVCEFVAGRGK